MREPDERTRWENQRTRAKGFALRKKKGFLISQAHTPAIEPSWCCKCNLVLCHFFRVPPVLNWLIGIWSIGNNIMNVNDVEQVSVLNERYRKMGCQGGKCGFLLFRNTSACMKHQVIFLGWYKRFWWSSEKEAEIQSEFSSSYTNIHPHTQNLNTRTYKYTVSDRHTM